MGRTQPHRITGLPRSRISTLPLLKLNDCSGPVGQKRHSQPREGPRGGKGLLEELCAGLCQAHDFGGSSLRFGSRFRGFRRSASIGGEPVAIVACLLRSAIWGPGW